MVDKILKILLTDLSWRTEPEQIATIEKSIGPFDKATAYRGLDGREQIVRPTRRKEQVIVYAASLACLSKDEDDLIDFLRKAKSRNLKIICVEEKFEWYPQRSLSIVLRSWKLARNSGAAKAGGKISADKRKAIAKEKAETIRPFWHLPNKDYKTYVLLRQADICKITAEKHLGKRKDAQREFIAVAKRKATIKRKQEAGRV